MERAHRPFEWDHVDVRRMIVREATTRLSVG